MKISKCEGCLKRQHELYGACPYYEIISTSFLHIHKAYSFICSSRDDSYLNIPQEWLDYDFSCNYYSPKPKT